MQTAHNNYSMWWGFLSGCESMRALPTAVAHSLQNSPKGRRIFSIAVKIDIALMKSDVTSAIDLTDVEAQLVGQHLHCSGSTLCFLPLQQSPRGMCSALWTPGWSKCCFQIYISLLIEAFPKMWLLILLLCIVWCLIRCELPLFSQLENLEVSVSSSIANVHWM